MTAVDIETLRATFLALLTVDSETRDRRRRDYNQAIFIADGSFAGGAVFAGTTLDMVMDKFDHAVRETGRRAHE